MKRLIENLLDVAVRPVSRARVFAWWWRTGRAHRRAHAVTALLLVLSVLTRALPVNATTCTTSGNNVTIAANCIFDAGTYTFTGTLTINAGVTVTAASNVGSGQVIIVSDNIDVQGTIDGNSLGFAAGSGPGEPAGTFAGAGHGGDGGDYQGAAGGVTYGSVTSPSTLGSGASEGFAGGAAIKLSAPSGTITIGGIVRANGGGGNQAGGAGGSIWIDAGTLSGAGSITANGGTNTASDYGGGGGGRIALYYNTDSSTITKQAFGGGDSGNANTHGGGAGTIFIDDKDDAFTNGNLVVDNNNSSSIGSSSETTQVTTASQTYDNLTVRNGARYVIPNTHTLTLVSGGTLTGGGASQAVITAASGGTLDLNAASLTLTGVDVTNNGTVSDATSLTLNDSTFVHNGSLPATVTAITLQSAGTFVPMTTSGLTLSTLTVQSGGTFEQRMLGAIPITTVTVQSGGNLTHTANTTSKTYELSLSSTAIDVQSGSTVNVNSRGFQAGSGTGEPSGSFAGAGHGGDGGDYITNPGGITYGSVTAPVTLGSGASEGFAGGGAVKLVATGTLTVAGTISADGGSGTAAGGAGGSVWLDAGTLAGAGTVRANGGANTGSGYGGGAGGRVAVYFDADSSTTAKQAFGGGATGGGHQGGAGSIFIDDKDDALTNGSLIIDNNNGPQISTSSETTQVTVSTQTYDSVTVRNGAKYVIPNTFTLTIASGGTLAGGGATQPLLTVSSGGTFNVPSATQSISQLDVLNNGTVGIVTSLTIGPTSTFTHSTSASFSAGLSSLTAGSSGSGTFTQSGLGTLSIPTVTVASGGVMNHVTNTTSKTHELSLSSTTVDVQSGGSINVNGRGFQANSGTGAGINSFTGGGHGGRGGYYGASNVGGVTYGDIRQPTTMGSGSNGGFAGGGTIKLVVTGTLTVAGTVSANGGGGNNAGGAGGSVWIDTGTLSGAGSITANGGANSGNDYAGGGGGRVAVYFDTDSSTTARQAFGGLGTSQGRTGGAGSVFIDDKNDSLSNGEAIFDNNNQAAIVSTSTTDQVTTASQTFDAVTIKNGARYLIPNTFTLTIPSTGTLTASGAVQPAIVMNSGGTFNPPTTGTYTFTSIDVTNNGTLNTVTNLSLNDSTFTHNGTFGASVTDVTCQSTGTFIAQTTSTFSPTNLTVQSGGAFEQRLLGAISITNVTVQSGGTLRHTTNTTSKIYELSLSSTTIDVQSGGNVNVDGFGFQAGSGTGAGINSFTGGGHGGRGGYYGVSNVGGVTYGSVIAPTTLGSGSNGGFAGGGAIKLVASGTLTVNGTISANGGGGSNAGGAGGSVWLDAGTLAGAGTIRANGGANSGNDYAGGGGGRVAVYFDTDSSTTARQAFGGLGTSQGRTGGAGSVYIDDKNDSLTNGNLVVDNNNQAAIVSTSTTDQVTTASQTYDAITVRNGARYLIPNTFTLSIASGGTLTGGGSNRPLITTNSGGTFVTPSSTFTFTDIDFTNNGTIGTLTSLSLNTSTFIHNGNFSGTVTSITPQSGGTFAYQVTTGLSLSSVTVQSGGTFEQRMLGALSVTTLTVQSGGSVTHTANTTSKLYEVNLSAATVDVQSGGSVNVNSKGFSGGNGTGAGGVPGGYGAGGGHGGAGGNSNPGSGGGTTYGSNTNPVTLGSGGGNGSGNTGGSGGGAVKLVVSGTLTISGSITSNGGNGAGWAGGGAGGSIWIQAATIAGSGTTTAVGGNGGSNGGTGGGGGGRQAWFYGTKTYSGTCNVAGGLRVAGGSATDGAVGTCYEEVLGGPPVVTVVTHVPASPLATDPVTISGTATDDTGVTKIELYLDGTAPANLVRTCLFSPAQTPASCAMNVGALSNASHTTTVRAYDDTSFTDGTENFAISGSTLSSGLNLGRLKAGAAGVSFSLSFTLASTESGTLTVTFPVGFTVTAAGQAGQSSGCLSSFGFTSSTLTATKTSCSGSVTLGGATVTNPATAGFYKITWTNDHGEGGVHIVDDDQVTVSGQVDPQLTFNVGSQTAACDGTFSGSGGALGLGALTAAAVASSDVSSVPHVCARLTSNAGLGAIVSVRSAFGALQSASTPGDQISSSTGTLVAGTSGYGLCAGSSGGDSGRDATTPAGATPAAAAPFNGSCTTSSHAVGGLTPSAQTVWSISGPSQNAFFRLFLKAAVSSATPAHADYQDLLTFIATGTY